MQFRISRRSAIKGIGALALLSGVSACSSVGGSGARANDQLFGAAKSGNVTAIEGALAAGADVNAFDYSERKNGRTALSYAAQNNHPDAIRALVAAGAQVNLANNTGYTALHHAAEAGAVEAAKTLLELGADKNLRHLGGFTPRNVALENNHPELAELLR
jgi:uncharacterized protein